MSMRSRLCVAAMRDGARHTGVLCTGAIHTGAIRAIGTGMIRAGIRAGVLGAGVIWAAVGGAGVMGAGVLGADPAMAASECLGAPNRDAPAGSHWYYHMDRTADRKCWYLHATVGAADPPTGALERPVERQVERAERPPVRPAARPMPRQAQAAADGARPPMSESEQAALYLEFLRWREQQRSAQ